MYYPNISITKTFLHQKWHARTSRPFTHSMALIPGSLSWRDFQGPFLRQYCFFITKKCFALFFLATSLLQIKILQNFLLSTFCVLVNVFDQMIVHINWWHHYWDQSSAFLLIPSKYADYLTWGTRKCATTNSNIMQEFHNLIWNQAVMPFEQYILSRWWYRKSSGRAKFSNLFHVIILRQFFPICNNFCHNFFKAYPPLIMINSQFIVLNLLIRLFS